MILNHTKGIKLDAKESKSTPVEVKGFMNCSEAAKYIGISKRQLFRWRNQYCTLKFYQIGRVVRFLKSDIDAFMEEYCMLPIEKGGTSNG